jgi:hypothetical protein
VSRSVRVVRDGSEWKVEYDKGWPSDVFFDTNVWRGLNDEGTKTLRSLQDTRGFRYRYSVTNFVELASHLEDPPSAGCQSPFGKFRSCFRRMLEVCDQEVLPSPEMEFLVVSGLQHCIDPVWIPDAAQIAAKVEAITRAKGISDLYGVLDVGHYRTLRKVDGESWRALMEELEQFERPITSSQVNKLLHWFMKLANFFLLVRPSNEKAHFNHLTLKERDRFTMALTEGAGKLFQTHCTTLVKRTINERKTIDPNDLYDMLQLVLLRDNNRLFVTGDKSFFQYQLNDPKIERVLSWEGFRNSA